MPPPRRSPRLKLKKEGDQVAIVKNQFNFINYDTQPVSAKTKRSMDLLEVLGPQREPQRANTKKAFDLMDMLKDDGLLPTPTLPTPTIKAQVDSPASRTRSKKFSF